MGVAAGMGVAANKGKGAVAVRTNAARPNQERTLVFICWGAKGLRFRAGAKN
jgi:hypothetical protein